MKIESKVFRIDKILGRIGKKRGRKWRKMGTQVGEFDERVRRRTLDRKKLFMERNT